MTVDPHWLEPLFAALIGGLLWFIRRDMAEVKDFMRTTREANAEHEKEDQGRFSKLEVIAEGHERELGWLRDRIEDARTPGHGTALPKKSGY